jgi:hypothetical protein
MQRYLLAAAIALVIVILLWVGLAIIAATRDPREPPPSPEPVTQLEVAIGHPGEPIAW